jgi:hypothetical protein
MKIAIVGPEEKKWTEVQKQRAKAQVYDLLLIEKLRNPNVVLVSGHCPKGGVDIWAEEIADKLGIQKKIYSAPANQWNDKILFENEFHKAIAIGYRSRNIQIAEACDVLYCIVPFVEGTYCYHHKPKQHGKVKLQGLNHPQNGGCWTMKHTKKLGKETHLVVIE